MSLGAHFLPSIRNPLGAKVRAHNGGIRQGCRQVRHLLHHHQLVPAGQDAEDERQGVGGEEGAAGPLQVGEWVESCHSDRPSTNTAVSCLMCMEILCTTTDQLICYICKARCLISWWNKILWAVITSWWQLMTVQEKKKSTSRCSCALRLCSEWSLWWLRICPESVLNCPIIAALVK